MRVIFMVLAAVLAGACAAPRIAVADPAGDRAILKAEYQTLIEEPQTRAVDLPYGRSIRPGDHSKDIPLIRLALANYGFVPAAANNEDPLLYDDGLVNTVEKFQDEAGLKGDGVIGAWTRRSLRGMDNNRILRIQQSLAQPNPPSSGRYILVNVAAGMVYAMNDGKIELSSRAVVGKPGEDTTTPVFSSTIQSVTINPIWNAPKSIVEKEFGGNAHVEKPGPSNPLGKIRIDIPNRYAVFLHSTNHPQFFSRDMRDFSHGCVRVEKITELARWLTGDALWNDNDLDRQLDGWKTKRVQLETPMPIYLQYRTATVASTGSVIYHADPYHQAAPPEAVTPIPDEPSPLSQDSQTMEPNAVSPTAAATPSPPAAGASTGEVKPIPPQNAVLHPTSAIIHAPEDVPPAH